jgi:phosphatidylglycerophosphate synthase
MDEYTNPDAPLSYRYTSINNSLLDRYLFCHWWPIAIKVIPARMSANAVSVLGSMFCWLAFAILSGLVVGPLEVFAPRHPWIFGVVAVCIFLYQTLDALDGVQARRTGVSGPMGEFVDHWFDSINAFMIPLGIALAFPAIPYTVAALTVFFCGMAEWISARATLKRGLMEFGPISSEEVLTLIYIFFLVIWWTGYQFWASPSPALGFPPIWIVYFLAPLFLVLTVLINAKYSHGELGWFCVAAATLVPILAWMLFTQTALKSLSLLLGGLTLGCAATRFAGDVLRERLVGLRYPVVYVDSIVIDALLLGSLLVPYLPGWVPLAVVCSSLGWMAFTLARQFRRMKDRVTEVTGTDLFRLVRNPRT